jgi:hypothetical protein
MHGTGIEKKVEICTTNLANKTKCMSTNAKKWKKNEDFFIVGKKYYKYKKGLGNAHPASKM